MLGQEPVDRCFEGRHAPDRSGRLNRVVSRPALLYAGQASNSLPTVASSEPGSKRWRNVKLVGVGP